MNRRILASFMVIGLVAAGAGLSTTALFNDTETSADNQFTAGELDLRVDWEESYNGEHVETQELTNDPGTIFDFEDLKPGDYGEATVSLHLEDNPGWIWMKLNQTSNWDNACTEPEHNAEGTCGSEGELDEELEFTIWSDDGDNELQEDEKVIFEGTAEELEEKSTSEGILLDGNSSTEETEPFPGAETGYIGVKWNLPLDTGNRIQGDSVSYDVTFYTEQRRHNDNPENPWSDEPEEKPGDGNGSDGEKKNESESFYQVDLVGGDPIENLSESTYHSEGRMQRYIHGKPGDAISKESESDQVKTGTGSVDCVDSEPFTVNKKQDTATVEFEVLNKTPECGTGTELSLVSYEKPYPGWIAERAGEQEIFDSTNHRFDPGNHSLTVAIPDINNETSEDSEEEPKDSDGEESEGSDAYVATQGSETVEISPLKGNMTVQELYDYRLPSRYDNEFDNEALNGATYPENGPYYGSAGTGNLQQADTSTMFLYDGPNGLSFVVVHEGGASDDGGSATFEISNLSESGQWVVKDDLYFRDDGQKANSNYDIWDVNSSTHTIDWTWGGGGEDGGAFQPVGEDFSFTIDPAFNEESELYEQFYNGDVEDWQVLSGDMNNPERTSLNLTQEVTVEAQ